MPSGRLRGCFALAIAIWSMFSVASELAPMSTTPAPLSVRYYPPDISSVRQAYEPAVVIAALDATIASHGPYEFTIYKEPMNFQRGIRELARGEIVNIYTNPIAPEFDRPEIEIIPIPIMKGLLGYRALVVKKDRVDQILQIDNLPDFRELKVGQLNYWADVAVYESNDFSVETAKSMDMLFGMLSRSRFDHIPLGISEVESLFSAQSGNNENLVIMPNTYLYYPFPVYVYANTREPRLAARLKKGLEKIQKNGELESLFLEHFGETLNKIHSSENTVFKLDNPLIPPRLRPNMPILSPVAILANKS